MMKKSFLLLFSLILTVLLAASCNAAPDTAPAEPETPPPAAEPEAPEAPKSDVASAGQMAPVELSLIHI